MAPWGRIAAQLAAKAALGPHTVTPEEEEALLAVPDGGSEPEPERVMRAVQAFAAAGVVWRPSTARERG